MISAFRGHTSVSAPRPRRSALRVVGRLVSLIAPRTAMRLAAWLWSCPPKAKSKRSAVPRGAIALTVELSGRAANGFCWPGADAGSGAGKILVQHGWGGSVAGMGELIDALRGTGRTIIAFDAFGHGTTGTGRHGWRQSSLIELADLVLAVDREHGPFEAIVAHSAGCPAVARALRLGVRTKKLVLLAPLVEPLAQAHLLSQTLGLTEAAAAAWPDALLERFGVTRADIDMCQPPPPPWPQTLICHDLEDALSPLAGSRQLRECWPKSTLVETLSLGHFRITRDLEVLAEVRSFLSRGLQT
jgi:pimeloyl-ACP methyl ester carboxylesterase